MPVPVRTVELLLFTVAAGVVRVVCVVLLTTVSEALRDTVLLSLIMVAGILLSLLYKPELSTVLVRVSIPVFRMVLLVLLFKLLMFVVPLTVFLESVDLFTTSPVILFLSFVTTEPLLIAGL